jgi:flagellar protein FliL
LPTTITIQQPGSNMAEVEELENEEIEEPKSSSKKFIFIGVGVVVLIVGVLGALFALGVIGGGGESNSDEAQTAEVEIKLPEKEDRPTVPLEEFVVNLADAEQARYLKAKVELEVANEEVKVSCEGNLPAIRNSLVELLSSKTFSQIRDIRGKTRLRQEIIVRLNEILGTNGITQVYFTDFIIQ